MKVYFYPGLQDLKADFVEIPLLSERSSEGIVFLCGPLCIDLRAVDSMISVLKVLCLLYSNT
jgi:hypothetical protein